jgi:hypothetical protein
MKIFSSSNYSVKVPNNNPNKFSEKLELVVSKILGKRVILWEKILFIINKVLFIITLLIHILYRGDLVTVIIFLKFS